MTKIKICGITKEEEVENLIKLEELPEYIGFVFAKSKRFLTLDEAVKLKKMITGTIETVGVFVNPTIEYIEERLEVIDIIQLHGEETEEFIQTLKTSKNPKFSNKKVIKAISVTSIEDILKWENSEADFLLLDNGKGGTGQKFDWNILDNLCDFHKEYFLAGGLNPENARKSLDYNPYCVDVSSGVEENGLKSLVKIKEFIGEIRK